MRLIFLKQKNSCCPLQLSHKRSKKSAIGFYNKYSQRKMATATRPESLDVEPAVKATSANRQLMQKNLRASDNWFRAKRALDKEKRQYESKVNIDKNALLKQRERLQSVSLTLDTVHESESSSSSSVSSTPRTPHLNAESGLTKRRMTLADVYDSLIRSVREQNSGGDNRSVYSEPNLTKSSTASFDSKKVKRKPVKFSLQSLQRAQSNLQEKLEALNQMPDNDETNNETQCEPESPRGVFDLSEDERKLGPKLHLAPTTLPPIRSQTVFKPRSRSFDRPSGPTPTHFEDLQYCRYLRGAVRGARRNSAPIVRHVKRPSQKIQ